MPRMFVFERYLWLGLSPVWDACAASLRKRPILMMSSRVVKPDVRVHQ